MSEEFYNAVAKRLISFLAKEKLAPGMKYCLHLDDQDLILGISDALKRQVESLGVSDIYEFKDAATGEVKYTTYALPVNEQKVVFAHTGNMVDDFLTALRNRAGSDGFVLVCLSQSRFDTLESATQSLSSEGMPFDEIEIRKSIRQAIDGTTFNEGERTLLDFALEQYHTDRYGDKTSVSSYEPFLSAIERKKIVKEDFNSFGMVADMDGIQACTSYRQKAIRERFQDNADRFEAISRAYDYDNISEELDAGYRSTFIQELKKKKRNGEVWFEGYSYDSIKKSAVTPDDNVPVEIKPGTITIHSEDLPEKIYLSNEDYFIVEEGTTAAQKRKKHLLVFVPDAAENLTILFQTTESIRLDHIEDDKQINAVLQRESQKHASIKMTLNGPVEFGKAVLQKTTVFIAAFKVPQQYFSNVITRYRLNVPKTIKNRTLRLNIGEDNLVINPSGQIEDREEIENEREYSCAAGKRLILEKNRAGVSDDLKTIRIYLDFGSFSIPIEIEQEQRTVPPLTPEVIYAEKIIERRGFEWLGENKVRLGAREYAIKNDQLEQMLELESTLVSKGWISAELSDGILSERQLDVPDKVKDAYMRLLSYFKERHTCPSLAYYGQPGLKERIEECLRTVEECVFDIADGTPAKAYQGLLELGAVFQSAPSKRVMLSPVHPVNMKYQLMLTNANSFADSKLDRRAILEVGGRYALPVIKGCDQKDYEINGSSSTPEWTVYSLLNAAETKGSADFVKDLVSGKIEEYISHFSFLFNSKQGNWLTLSCVDLGSCAEVLAGVSAFLIGRQVAALKKPLPDIKISVHCYGDVNRFNAFEKLLDEDEYLEFLDDRSILAQADKAHIRTYESLSYLMSHIKFSLHDRNQMGKYVHLAFVSGAAEVQTAQLDLPELETGVMLNGLINVSSSTNSSGYYKTGFGAKNAKDTPFLDFAARYNSMYFSAYSSTPFNSNLATTIEVTQHNEEEMEVLYNSSNWVVMVDPRVDPKYYLDQSNSDGLMVIHYTDQWSSNGYDAITLTKKSDQYVDVIKDEIAPAAGGIVEDKDIKTVINFANAFNGSWLLSFLSSANENMPKSRMSTLAAVKAALAYYDTEDVVWVPVSLEELLRVSTGLGLSATSGLISAKNLGFDRGVTSDDVMLVGVRGDGEHPEVLLHPVEVKVGDANSGVITKGVEQATATYKNLMQIWWDPEVRDLAATKIARNYFMQVVIASASKMKMYEVFPEVNWEYILTDCRKALQNEDYTLVPFDDFGMPKGTVCAFSNQAQNTQEHAEEEIQVIEVPIALLARITVGNLSSALSTIGCSHEFSDKGNGVFEAANENIGELDDGGEQSESDTHISNQSGEIGSGTSTFKAGDNHSSDIDASSSSETAPIVEKSGIKIVFGRDETTGAEILWEPCDTEKLFHMNTGIIGTMGTGKTQFTKSMITQLYRERDNNLGEGELGILVFDYNSDYNESKPEFVGATNARVLSVYRLPFNPLALTQGPIFRPLLPIRTANSFKDTLSKIYNLGPKQERTLLDCIIKAYEKKGIVAEDPDTWSKEPPTFSDVYSVFDADEGISKNDSLAAAMYKLNKFKIFESESNNTVALYSLLKGVVVIDLSGSDPDIQSLVVAMTLDLFYSQMQAAGPSEIYGHQRKLTKFILVDEADNFLSEGFPTLKRILKEGRKFGVGVILSTQFLKHFKAKDEDYSKYILTWVVHKVDDLDPSDIRFVFNTEPKCQMEQQLFNAVKRLKIHCSMVKLGNSSLAIPMRDKPFWELMDE